MFKRDPDLVRSVIPAGKLTWLGRVGGDEFATYNGAEFLVDSHPTAAPGDFVRAATEILVRKVTVEDIDGSQLERHQTHRGHRVPKGTYAAKAAKANKPAVDKPMRAWSVLAILPAMRHREPRRLASVPESPRVTVGAWKALVSSLKPEVLEIGGHQPPEAGPAGTIADLASRGVQLTLPRGYLLAKSRTPLRFDDRELIEKSEELLTAYLAGQPLSCVMCDQPAVDYGFPRAPMCAAHLEPRT